MKIEEVMLEASVDRKQFGKETVRANQKANIARSAAFRAQMDAKPEEPAAATPAAPAATPAATPNYGKGTPGIPNIQVTPGIKTPQPAAKPATQASPTPNYGPKAAATPVTLANPIAKPGAATPTPGTDKPGLTPVPGAGMPTPPGAGMPKPVAKAATPSAGKPGEPGRKATGPEFSNIVGSNFMKGFAQGVGSPELANAVNAASQSNISAQKAKDGTPAVPGEEQPAAEPTTAKAGEKELSPGASVPGATPNYGTAKPGQPVTLANPIGKPGTAKPGATPTPGTAKPDQDVTLDDPAVKAGAAKPGQPQTQDSPIAKPAAAPTPAAAKGKTMTKQEIMAWISRNDEDNAALQSFKDGITAAEKSGAGAEPAATPNYGKATPGIQNVQATPSKVTAAPKIPAATPNYGPKTAAPAARQPQMASKQYKKAPL